MGRIRKPPKTPPAKLPAKTEIKNFGLSFSFKHLDLDGNHAFSLKHRSNGYTKTFLERLRDLSGMDVDDFRTGRSIRVHQIDWSKTSQPEGFRHLNKQLKGIPAWQFNISANEHGRVHGFLIDEVFYVVWLDPKHKLYAKKR